MVNAAVRDYVFVQAACNCGRLYQQPGVCPRNSDPLRERQQRWCVDTH